jgi:hypothetical protein
VYSVKVADTKGPFIVALERCASKGIAEHIEYKRYEGGHALTQERLDDIVRWLARCGLNTASNQDIL